MIEEKRIGRGCRQFLLSQRGSISIYLLLVLGAIMVLFITIYNFGRYRLAVRQAENALELSMMSVLSHYDPDLIRELGLFALDSENKELEVVGQRYFAGNLTENTGLSKQEVTAYRLYFPAEGRLNIQDILETQAVEWEQWSGWIGAAEDLLAFMGVDGLKGLANQFAAALAIEGSRTADSAAEGEKGGTIGQVDDGDTGAAPTTSIELWHFLLPWPVHKGFVDRRLPDFMAAEPSGTAGGLGEDGAEGLAIDLGAADLPWLNYFFVQEASEKEEEGVAANQGATGEGEAKGAEAGETGADDVGDQALLQAASALEGFSSRFARRLREMLAQGKNKLLLSEYLLQQLDYATAKAASQRYMAKAEVEYVLFRQQRSWHNLQQSAFQLLLLRSSINFAAELLAGHVVNEATLLNAMQVSLRKGGKEVEQLFAGKRVPALPGRHHLTLSYRDHLRLLLLCQDTGRQLQGVQELIQVNLWHWGQADDTNTGPAAADIRTFDLRRYATQLAATAEMSVDLWPWGQLLIRRSATVGYDRPFAIVSGGAP